MQSILKSDVSEIKTFDHPPKAIKLVLKAVCLLLGVQPIMKKNSKGEYKPSYWKAAISSEVLGDPNLPQRLSDYDRNQLTQELMAQVEDILSEANYTYQSALKVSRASAGLFKWVKAMRDYYYIFKDMEPRRDALVLAENQWQEHTDKLKAKRLEIQEIDQAL